jgi:hypothetical protein
VVTVPRDLQMAEGDVDTMLLAEYQLLCQCDAFKHAFDDLAVRRSVTTIPRMFSLLSINIFLIIFMQISTLISRTRYLVG